MLFVWFYALTLDPETKHPSFFKAQGISNFDDLMLDILTKNGLNYKGAPVFIQSFEVGNLQEIRKKTEITLVQLVDDGLTKQPFDFILNGDKRTNGYLVSKEGLEFIAKYADVVAPYKEYLVPRNDKGQLDQPTDVILNAHAAGLKVHTFTFRPENAFLPTNLKRGNTSEVRGDSESEIYAFLEAGLDGFFTDASDYGRKAVDRFMSKQN